MGAPGFPALGPTRASTLVLNSRGDDVREHLGGRTGVDPSGEREEGANDDAPLHEPEGEHDGAVEAREREVRAEDGEERGDDCVGGG